MPKQQPQQSQQHSPQPSAVEPTRRQLGRLALGGLTAMALAACGGGGDDSDDGLDLRAAYDRITEGMDHAEVDRAVGRGSIDPGNLTTRNWSSSGQYLQVGFTKLGDDSWVVGVASWWIPNADNRQKELFFG